MIRVGIVGYGNLGQGVEKVAALTGDMGVVGIFTRRDPHEISSLGSKVYYLDDLNKFKDEIDVCILCGGSASDLPNQTPEITKNFNTVDSYDNHGNIPNHFQKVDEVARGSKTVSVISAGWDPGLFSINRLMGESILPKGDTYTFWGKGVSQGHSDAIRRVEGVKFGVQYTLPNEEVIERIVNGEKLELTTGDRHTRLCYVVPEADGDEEKIRQEIITMPNYFDEYDTTVNFISEEEFNREHKGMPHGGKVLRIGNTSDAINQVYEFNLKLDSNPEFTASVIVAFARACFRLSQEGKSGAYTVLDIPPKYLSAKSDEDLRRELL